MKELIELAKECNALEKQKREFENKVGIIEDRQEAILIKIQETIGVCAQCYYGGIVRLCRRGKCDFCEKREKKVMKEILEEDYREGEEVSPKC